jgi:hypothetical protein
MKHLYLFFALFIFAPLISSAQTNFQPGYVITLQGDSLRGFIDYKDWSINPKQIAFKKDKAVEQPQVYTAADLNAFAVKENESVKGYEYYKRYVGKISWDNVGDAATLSEKLDTDTQYGTFFLKLLSTGKNVTLYKYTDHLKSRYFIAKKGKQPVELAYHMFLLYTGDTQKVITQNIYRDQLQQLAVNYQPQNTALVEAIKNTGYTNDLKKIIEQLNGLTIYNPDKIPVFVETNHNGSVSFFAGAGVNNTTNDYAQTGSLYSVSSKSNSPEINLGVDVFFNKNVKKLIFRTSLNFSMNRTTLSYFPYTDADTYSATTQSFKYQQNNIVINPQLLYNVYNTSAVKIYGAAGLALNYSIYTNKQAVPFALRSTFVNTTAQVGVQLNNKIDIYAGYYIPVFTYVDDDNTIRLSSYHFGINYHFGK